MRIPPLTASVWLASADRHVDRDQLEIDLLPKAPVIDRIKGKVAKNATADWLPSALTLILSVTSRSGIGKDCDIA